VECPSKASVPQTRGADLVTYDIGAGGCGARRSPMVANHDGGFQKQDSNLLTIGNGRKGEGYQFMIKRRLLCGMSWLWHFFTGV
jgi:hypothetical protein